MPSLVGSEMCIRDRRYFMYTRKSLLNFKFSWTQSKSRFRTFFLTKCRKKTKSRFEEKLSPGVLDLVNFFQKDNFFFSFFEKML